MPIISRRRRIADVRFNTVKVQTTLANTNVNFISIPVANDSVIDIIIRFIAKSADRTKTFSVRHEVKATCDSAGTVALLGSVSSFSFNDFAIAPTVSFAQGTANTFLAKVSSGTTNQTVDWDATYNVIIKQF